MKKLTILDLSSIMGGAYDPEKCKELQKEAEELENDPNPDWEKWAKKFEEYCFGIED